MISWIDKAVQQWRRRRFQLRIRPYFNGQYCIEYRNGIFWDKIEYCWPPRRYDEHVTKWHYFYAIKGSAEEMEQRAKQEFYNIDEIDRHHAEENKKWAAYAEENAAHWAAKYAQPTKRII